MVFQNYALYPHMTVRDNMAFSLKLAKAPQGRDRAARSAAPPASSASAPLLDRYPRQLSGGQRQRVAMGRAIVRDPQVFLFDEPLSNLDAKLRVQMRAEIKELHQRLKTTTIYVTHDQIEAMTMADKIVVMHGGDVEQIGAPLDLYDRPANLFVAGFIGSPAMNFLQGPGRAAARSASNGTALPLPQRTAATGTDGQAASTACGRSTGSSTDNGMPAKCMVIEPTGSETQVMARIADTPVICAFRERVTARPGRDDPHRARPGARRICSTRRRACD